MIAYIAGQITGDPDYRWRFADAQMVLESLGYIVLNPATLPSGMGYEQYMRIDMAMLEEADTVCFLPGRENSSGAKREHAAAHKRRKRILYYEHIQLWGGAT